MTILSDIFLNNILPIFLVAGLGVLLRVGTQLEIKPLSRATLYIFSPCLVFSSLATATVNGQEMVTIVLFVLAIAVGMGGLTFALGKGLRLDRKQMAALLLGVMFANNGNFGLTITQLRYGDVGLARSVIYFSTVTVTVYSAGILIASSGSMNLRTALKRLAKLPAFYAPFLAILFYVADWQLHAGIMRGIKIAGDGAIPVMLVVLGMQMADLRRIEHLKLALPAVGLRLLVAPMFAILIASVLGMSTLPRDVSLLQTSMPTAVVTIILATEFDALPEIVTTIVVLSTLLSMLTIPLLIALLSL